MNENKRNIERQHFQRINLDKETAIYLSRRAMRQPGSHDRALRKRKIDLERCTWVIPGPGFCGI